MPLFGKLKEKVATIDSKHDRKKHLKGTPRYTLKQSLKQSLGSGVKMQDAVKLPKGEDKDDWIAMNTVEIYNSTNLSFGFVSDFCTPSSCPEMTAGTKYKYLWEDGQKYNKPVSVAACEYVELLIKWVSVELDNEAIFIPSGKNYPKTFLPIVRKIWKRLARVYFHIYYHHWEQVKQLEAEGHVNTCFKHFYYFATEFELVKQADLEPVQALTQHLDK